LGISTRATGKVTAQATASEGRCNYPHIVRECIREWIRLPTNCTVLFPSSCNIREQEQELWHPIKLQKDFNSALWLAHKFDQQEVARTWKKSVVPALPGYFLYYNALSGSDIIRESSITGRRPSGGHLRPVQTSLQGSHTLVSGVYFLTKASCSGLL